jgi:beta-lactamase superfamily II metal-dependent hydrolase
MLCGRSRLSSSLHFQSEATVAANDYFSLEAVNAKHGDALILHYGTKKRPQHILIDGGPTGVYANFLEPRLAALAAKRGKEQLPLEHVFVTHLDSDHIKGVLDFAQAMAKGEAPATTTSFWFNTFSDTMKELPPETSEVLERSKGTVKLASVDAVMASVKEGQKLRDTTKLLPVAVNGGEVGPLFADKKGVKLKVSSQLNVTLVCPSRKHLRDLAADWNKKAKPTKAETAAYLDKSVYNLSSLVIVVAATGGEGNTRRMLLTGDARGDHMLEGLANAGFLDADGKAHFDLVKVSHHGSDRNFEKDFFERITADHYVISGDGRHENPSEPVLEWIGQTGKGNYRVHLTNEGGTGFGALEKNIADAKEKVKSLKEHLVFRKEDDLSVRVDLMAPPPF